MFAEGQVIGFTVGGPDNNRYMFQGQSQPPRCSGCRRILDPAWVDPEFTLSAGRHYDISYTYDGCLIVSDNFRVAARNVEGANYIRLPSQPAFYRLDISKAPQLTFDTARRKTKFSNYCETCNSFAEVAGAKPVFLVDPPIPLPDHFIRTDTQFGSYDEQGPLLLIGPGLAKKLEKADLKGLELGIIQTNGRAS